MGLPEILVIGAIFFLLFGAKRIPEIGEGLGKAVKELGKIRNERKATREEREKDQKGNLVSNLRREATAIPGLKEVKEIKETVDQIKSIKNILK